jgi:WD40 repeat protein
VKASNGLSFHAGRRLLATADAEGTVTIASLGPAGRAPPPERLREVTFDKNDLASRCLAFSPDGATLAVGTYERVHLVDPGGGETRTCTAPSNYVRGLAFGPGGSLLGVSDNDGYTHVIRLADLARTATVRNPENWTETVAFAGDDRLLVGDYDGHLLLWDIARASASGFVSGGAAGGEDRSPLPAEALVRRLATFAPAGRGAVNAIAVRRGRVYYGCADGKVHVVDLESGERIAAVKGHDKPVSCFAFLDEHTVVTGSFDGTLRILDLAEGASLARVEGHEHPVWDVVALDDHHVLAAVDDGKVHRFYVDWSFV